MTIIDYWGVRLRKLAEGFVDIYADSPEDAAKYLREQGVKQSQYADLRPVIRQVFKERGWNYPNENKEDIK
jgi:hypothetical protein